MRLVRHSAQRLTFEIELREKQLFCRLLLLYPLVPPGHHRLSKTNHRAEDQELLDQALASVRREQRSKIRAFLNDDQRFRLRGQMYQVTLARSSAQWLLQVLNDIRVGSWLQLGAPAQLSAAASRLTAENAHYFWAMEVSGYFEMALLEGLDGAAGPVEQ